MNDICKWCGNEIKISIFKGTDWCSENCRKILKGEMPCSYDVFYRGGGRADYICNIHKAPTDHDSKLGPHRPCVMAEA